MSLFRCFSWMQSEESNMKPNKFLLLFGLDCDQILGAELRVTCHAPDVFVTVENTKTYHQSLNS